ncbi:MAG: hypothetical protein HOE54_05900 [Gammaproteobacteria bacterium]|nr:hypothetical protein [Gammaproteobacteria bacterium]
MLEDLANISEFVGAIVVLISLVFIGYQLTQTRKQLRADALQQRINTRLQTWNDQLDKAAYQSALEKIFEFELYRKDVKPYELEQLTRAEQQAMFNALAIELVYFQNLYYQRAEGMINHDQSLPLDYIRVFSMAPRRRQWKDQLRISNHFPPEFILHVDAIVKKYDEVERRMESDQDADFDAVVQEVFELPAPPNWLGKSD